METQGTLTALQSAINEIGEKHGKVTVINGAHSGGRLIEIYGPHPSPKMAFTLVSMAKIQKAGGICAFIDVNHNFDDEFAEQLGVDTENLIMSQPPNNDVAWEVAYNLIRSGAIDIVVIKSYIDIRINANPTN